MNKECTESLECLKFKAKKEAEEKGLSIKEVLENIAKEYGFDSWKELRDSRNKELDNK